MWLNPQTGEKSPKVQDNQEESEKYQDHKGGRDTCPRCRYCRKHWSFQYQRFPTCPVHDAGLEGYIKLLHKAGGWN